MSRECKGTNAQGDPCGAPPLRDEDYCRAHSPSLPVEARFGTPAQAAEAGMLGGRATRRPRLAEVAQQRFEAAIDEVLRPYFRALGIVGWTDDGKPIVDENARPVMVGKEGARLIPSDIEDLGAEIAAAEKLWDRIHGKPKQSTEVTGADGGPVQMAAVDLSRLSPDEKRALIALLEKAEG